MRLGSLRPAQRLAVVLAVAVAVGVIGCGTAAHQIPAQTAPSPRAHVTGGPPLHIAVIVMENEEYQNIIGSSSAPYTNALAHRYALARSAFAISHPSLPNYLALTGGTTFGISSDCSDCSVPGTGLAGQLDAAAVSWKAYMENMPRPCFQGASAYPYAKKHDPFMYYRALVSDPAACNRVVPMTELASDERARALPRFIWITPNLCHDAHDCQTSTGDRFLRGFVPSLLRAMGSRALLILTWDEGSTDNGCCRLALGGHVVTVLAGSDARSHSTMTSPTDHYSILQLIEDLFGLPRMRGAACPCTPTLQPLLK